MAAKKPLVLVADDDADLGKAVLLRLQQWGYRTAYAPDKTALMRELAKEEPAVTLLDLRFGEHDGTEILQQLMGQRPDRAVIMLTAHGSIPVAVTATRSGAYDFLEKPVDFERLRMTITHAIERQALNRRVRQLEAVAPAPAASRPLWGEGPAMTRLREQIATLARADATVLLLGESGTGKELVARSLHEQSARAGGPFVPVNMAALPRELVESTLFGHEKGAFTGADQAQAGCCETAHEGTLFLDEIGEMDLSIQAKLLRFLQERTVQRVGSPTSKPVDVRVVAATNRDLLERVGSGQFREDLYYRLHVVPIVTPPLRERREDVPLLAGRFLERAAGRYGKEFTGFTPDALAALTAYGWPGNVRQLENMMERLVILSPGPEVRRDDLPPEVLAAPPAAPAPGSAPAAAPAPAPADSLGLRPIDQMERQAIIDALQKARGNVREAAALLGLGQATVYRKIKRYNIQFENLGRMPGA